MLFPDVLFPHRSTYAFKVKVIETLNKTTNLLPSKKQKILVTYFSLFAILFAVFIL